MKVSEFLFVIIFISLLPACSSQKNEVFLPGTDASIYYSAPLNVQTRWISPENPTGEKGKSGHTNKGAKGNAFYIVQSGETKTLMDVNGAGIIQRFWMSGSIGVNKVQRRAVRIDMF